MYSVSGWRFVIVVSPSFPFCHFSPSPSFLYMMRNLLLLLILCSLSSFSSPFI